MLKAIVLACLTLNGGTQTVWGTCMPVVSVKEHYHKTEAACVKEFPDMVAWARQKYMDDIGAENLNAAGAGLNWKGFCVPKNDVPKFLQWFEHEMRKNMGQPA